MPFRKIRVPVEAKRSFFGPRQIHVGHKLVPRSLLAHAGPSWPQICLKLARVGSSWPTLAPRWRQVGPECSRRPRGGSGTFSGLRERSGEVPGRSGRLRGRSGRLREAPGRLGRLRGGSGTLREAPGRFRDAPERLRDAPGTFREARGGFGDAPGGSGRLRDVFEAPEILGGARGPKQPFR